MTKPSSTDSLLPTGAGVVLDIGTGDGSFVYQSARQDPSRFYIGVDAETSALRKVSTSAGRKREKGGVPNVLFLRAAAEALPQELEGVANEVHIHFPWGSLLNAVLTGSEEFLDGLRRVCVPGAWLEAVWAIDPERDASALIRLGIPVEQGTAAGLFLPDQAALERYAAAGFEVAECATASSGAWPHLRTSWARRLQGHRQLSYLIARAHVAT